MHVKKNHFYENWVECFGKTINTKLPKFYINSGVSRKLKN